MGNLKGKHTGPRKIEQPINFRVGAARPRLLPLPAPLGLQYEQYDQPPIFDQDGNLDYPVKDLYPGLSDDERFVGVLEALSQSPGRTGVFTQPTQPATQESPQKQVARVQVAAEDQVIWHDSAGRHHIIYGEYLTESLPEKEYTVVVGGSDRDQASSSPKVPFKIVKKIKVESVDATPQKPVRVLMYNRADAGQGKKFVESNAIPLFYLDAAAQGGGAGAGGQGGGRTFAQPAPGQTSEAEQNSEVYVGKVFQHCYFPAVDADRQSESVDLTYWINEVCEPKGDTVNVAEPETPGQRSGPVITPSGSNAQTSNTATSNSNGGSASQVNKNGFVGRSVVPGQPPPSGQPPTQTEQNSARPESCKDGEPFVVPSDAEFPVGQVMEERFCKRKLMHCEGGMWHVVEHQFDINAIPIFFSPYKMIEYTDGPVSPLVTNKLITSDQEEGSVDNTSTLVYRDDGKFGDLDDLLMVKGFNDTFPERLVLRMLCEPDPRGVVVMSDSFVGMLRDPMILAQDWLTIKTEALFTQAGVTQCGSGGSVGPILFTDLEAPKCAEEKEEPQTYLGPITGATHTAVAS